CYKTKWYLNGRSATQKEVLDKCTEYCIMVDNLCQFLPQERVSAFSSLNPAELLKETEKATGTSDLEENHNKIIDAQQTLGELVKKSGQQQKTVQEIQYRVQGLEKSVGEKKEQERRQTRLNNLKMKRPWAIFEEARKKAVDMRDQKTFVQNKLKKLEEENRPVEEEYAKVKGKIDSEEKKTLDSNRSYDSNEKEYGRVVGRKEELDNKISSKRKEIELTKKRRDERVKTLTDLTAQVEVLQKKIDELPSLDELKAQADSSSVELKKVREDIISISEKDGQVEEDIRENSGKVLQLKKELGKLNDIKQNRLRKVFDVDPNVYQAYTWIEQNRNKFEAEVYGPVSVELTVSKDEYANYVEMAVPTNVLKGFVVTNKADQERIISTLIEEKGLQIQVFKREDLDNEATQATQMRVATECGVLGTLDSVVNGPRPVLKVVEDFAALSKKFICTKETEKNIEKIAPGTYYTPSSVIVKVKSRYSSAVSDKVNNIRKARFLSTAIDTSRKEQLETQIVGLATAIEESKKKREGFATEMKQVENKKRELSTVVESYSRAKGEKEKLVRMKSTKQKEIKSLDADEDHEEKIEQLQHQVVSYQTEENEIVLKVGALLIKMATARMEANPSNCINRILRTKLNHLKIRLNENKKNRIEVEEEIKRIGDAYIKAKDEAVQKKKEAEKVCVLSDELNEIFTQLPDDLNEIEDEIQAEESKLKFRTDIEDNVEQMYEAAKEELSIKMGEMQSMTDEIKKKEDVMNVIKNEWLSKVKEVVTNIDTTFRVYMNQINCRGTVELEEKEEFDKYGIVIKTQFRKEGSLQQLNAHTQSGGERSVATMLYLLSLQEQTFCPFRLVDEINQGMDPLNERMIFSQIVKAVNKENAQQYFLVTPKLLSDLPFGENMTVLCVMNGVIDNTPYDFGRVIDALKESND
ncbi:structural maintenance of chromosome protein, putative, partial [Entamoeba invadens IP1]|uniref:structural maintenance of chromosome protein, putative n=1 Tax=Entamoeba invadens IP1 TaxID=370355 RepID=UPI0002C3D9E7